jgi:hypothetical protein
MSRLRRLNAELGEWNNNAANARAVASVLALGAYLVVGFVVRLWLTIEHLDAHDAQIRVFGYEFHHALIGIVCLLAAGLLALNDARPRLRAVLFGAGVALVVDETALLVELRPEAYFLWENVAALAIGALLLVVNVLYSRAYFVGAIRITIRHWRGDV